MPHADYDSLLSYKICILFFIYQTTMI